MIRSAKKRLKKDLEPRLAEAQANQRVVYFIDAAHFVFNCYLGFLLTLKFQMFKNVNV